LHFQPPFHYKLVVFLIKPVACFTLAGLAGKREGQSVPLCSLFDVKASNCAVF
jgi:hypothetical protein